MAHFGFFCLPMKSHIDTFLALARVLLKRGHRVTFFTISDNESKIRQAGAEFELREPQHQPHGSVASLIWRMADAEPSAVMRMQGELDLLRYDDILTNGPDAVDRVGVDTLVVDQAEACGGTVAEILGIPWVSLTNGLCLNSELAIPPFFTSWAYGANRRSTMRNWIGYSAACLATRAQKNLINRHRRRWNLPVLNRLDDTFSPFAQICQQNAEFDFPRTTLPKTFHYVGPLRRPVTCDQEFPWHRLDGKPLIYASLGTVVNRNPSPYRVIAEACAGLPAVGIQAQVILSLGGAEPGFLGDLPGSPIVVSYAPQRKLLARSILTITHGGLNTTLESLSEGVPLVAIPITFDQPGVAARIRWTLTGDFTSLSGLEASRLRNTIQRVTTDPIYRQSAARMKASIAATRGCEHAADIIEKVVETRNPVTVAGLSKPKLSSPSK